MTNYDSKLYKSFEDAGIHGVNLNANQQNVHCPKCHDDRKNNKNDKSLYLSPKKGLWKCFHCEWTGGLKDHNFVDRKEERTYTKPKERELPIGDKVISWFNKRGIERRTLEYFKIGESNEEGKNWINFPYYRNKELINVKRRDAKKDFRLTPNGELIFFNLDSIFARKEIIITEGEIDCMTVYQCDFFGVVSVPNGAQKGEARMQYLDNCFEYFEQSEKVIICVDNDEPGRLLSDELCRRIGRDKCWVVEYNEGCKDINDVLVKHGVEEVRTCIRSAKQHPVTGINKPIEYQDAVIDFHLNGFPSGDGIGYPEMDELLTYRGSELTVITGVPNSGKSAYLDQILIRLSARHGWRHGVLSREQWPHSIHMTKLVQVFTNKGLRSSEMSVDLIKKSMAFLDDHLFLFGIDDLSLDGILEKAKQLVLRHGIKSLVIDPWNTLDHDMKGFPNETEYIRNALKKVVLFKDMYSVHVFLVAHPTKVQTNANGSFMLPNLYSISGSAHWFNMVDNGICVYRNLGTRSATDPIRGDTVSVYIQKVRNFFVGKQGAVTFDYNYRTNNYTEQGADFECEYNRWMFENKKEEFIPEQLKLEENKEPAQLTDMTKLSGIKTSFDDYTAPTETIFKFENNGELKPNTDIETPF